MFLIHLCGKMLILEFCYILPDVISQCPSLGDTHRQDSRAVKCLNQVQLGLRHLPNRMIKLICYVLLRCGHSRGGIKRKGLPLSVTSSVEISKSCRRELMLDGCKPPAPPIPQVKWTHSERNIRLGTADLLMQLCSSQLVPAVPIGPICLLTMGSCAINLAEF